MPCHKLVTTQMTRYHARIVDMTGAARRLRACPRKDARMDTDPKRRGNTGSVGASVRAASAGSEADLSPRAWARRSRAAQGLPPQIDNAVALEQVATIVRWGLRGATQLEAPDGFESGRIKGARGARTIDADALQHRRDDGSLLLHSQVRPRLSDAPRVSGKEIS